MQRPVVVVKWSNLWVEGRRMCKCCIATRGGQAVQSMGRERVEECANVASPLDVVKSSGPIHGQREGRRMYRVWSFNLMP